MFSIFEMCLVVTLASSVILIDPLPNSPIEQIWPHVTTCLIKDLSCGGAAQWLAFALLDPAAPGSIPGVYSLIVDVAEVNQRRCCLEQWTEA